MQYKKISIDVVWRDESHVEIYYNGEHKYNLLTTTPSTFQTDLNSNTVLKIEVKTEHSFGVSINDIILPSRGNLQ